MFLGEGRAKGETRVGQWLLSRGLQWGGLDSSGLNAWVQTLHEERHREHGPG